MIHRMGLGVKKKRAPPRGEALWTFGQTFVAKKATGFKQSPAPFLLTNRPVVFSRTGYLKLTSNLPFLATMG